MSSYDVIDTIVAVNQRKLLPADIVQEEGELQFRQFVELEKRVLVMPKFEQLEDCVLSFEKHVSFIQKNFVRCGYFLNLIKREGLYRYCCDEASIGYTNFYKFCEDKLGISQKTAQRLCNINEHFCREGHELPDAYKKYGASKLAIMSNFKNGLEKKMDPTVTVRDLNKLAKYYAQNDWKVSLNTTWRDDLKAYDVYRQEQAKYKSAYLRRQKFKSAKELDEKERKPKLVSDPFKSTTRFLDQTLEHLDELRTGKNARFEALYDRLENVLKAFQAEVLNLQGEEMTDGL